MRLPNYVGSPHHLARWHWELEKVRQSRERRNRQKSFFSQSGKVPRTGNVETQPMGHFKAHQGSTPHSHHWKNPKGTPYAASLYECTRAKVVMVQKVEAARKKHNLQNHRMGGQDAVRAHSTDDFQNRVECQHMFPAKFVHLCESILQFQPNAHPFISKFKKKVSFFSHKYKHIHLMKNYSSNIHACTNT